MAKDIEIDLTKDIADLIRSTAQSAVTKNNSNKANIDLNINQQVKGTKDVESATKALKEYGDTVNKLPKNIENKLRKFKSTSKQDALNKIQKAYDEKYDPRKKGDFIAFVNAYKAQYDDWDNLTADVIKNIDLFRARYKELMSELNADGKQKYGEDIYSNSVGRLKKLFEEHQDWQPPILSIRLGFEVDEESAKKQLEEKKNALFNKLQELDKGKIKKQGQKLSGEIYEYNEEIILNEENKQSLKSFIEYYTELEKIIEIYGGEIPERIKEIYEAIAKADKDGELRLGGARDRGTKSFKDFLQGLERRTTGSSSDTTTSFINQSGEDSRKINKLKESVDSLYDAIEKLYGARIFQKDTTEDYYTNWISQLELLLGQSRELRDQLENIDTKDMSQDMIDSIQSRINLLNYADSFASEKVDEIRSVYQSIDWAARAAEQKAKDEEARRKAERAAGGGFGSGDGSGNGDSTGNGSGNGDGDGVGETTADITKLIELVEKLNGEISEIRKALGSVDDESGISNLISQFDTLIQKISELQIAVSKVNFNVVINDPSKDDEFWNKQLQRYREKFQKAVTTLGGMDYAYNAIQQAGYAGDIVEISNRFNQANMDNGNLNPEQIIMNYSEFFKYLKLAAKQMKDETGEFADAVRESVKSLPTDDIKQLIRNNKKAKAKEGAGEKADAITQAINDALTGDKEKEDIDISKHLGDLTGVIDDLKEIQRLLGEISDNKGISDLIDRVTLKLDSMQQSFRDLLRNLTDVVKNIQMNFDLGDGSLEVNASEKIEETSADTQYLIELFEKLNQEIAEIRKSLGSIDEETGVSSLMSMIQSLSRTLSDVYDRMFAIQNTNILGGSLDVGMDEVTSLLRQLRDVQTTIGELSLSTDWIGSINQVVAKLDSMKQSFRDLFRNLGEAIKNNQNTLVSKEDLGRTSEDVQHLIEAFEKLNQEISEIRKSLGTIDGESSVFSLVSMMQNLSQTLEEVYGKMSEIRSTRIEGGNLDVGIDEVVFALQQLRDIQGSISISNIGSDLVTSIDKVIGKLDSMKQSFRDLLRNIKDSIVEFQKAFSIPKEYTEEESLIKNEEDAKKLAALLRDIETQLGQIEMTPIIPRPIDFIGKIDNLLEGYFTTIEVRPDFNGDIFRRQINNIIDSEVGSFERLKEYIEKTIPKAIKKKNDAFIEESEIVSESVNKEIVELAKLKNQISDNTNQNNLSSDTNRITEQARTEMQAEEAAYDARVKAEAAAKREMESEEAAYDASVRAKVGAERAGEAIAESQDRAQKELLDTVSILEELNKLVSPTKVASSKNIQGFNDSLGGLFGDNKSFEKTLRSLKDWLKTFNKVKKNGSRTIGNFGAISGVTDAQFIENQNSIAQKLGYNIKWNTDDQGYLHGIVSESENAVKSLDEVFERIFNINEIVAKSNETPDLKESFNIEGISKATDEIEKEGNITEKSAQQKEEFVEANIKVANSGIDTAEEISKVTDNIVDEGNAAGRSANSINEASTRINESLNRLFGRQEDFIDNNNEMSESALQAADNLQKEEEQMDEIFQLLSTNKGILIDADGNVHEPEANRSFSAQTFSGRRIQLQTVEETDEDGFPTGRLNIVGRETTNYVAIVNQAKRAILDLQKAEHDRDLAARNSAPNETLELYNNLIADAQMRLDAATTAAHEFAEETDFFINDTHYDSKYLMRMFDRNVSQSTAQGLNKENIRYNEALRRGQEQARDAIERTNDKLANQEIILNNIRATYDQSEAPGVSKPVTNQDDLDELRQTYSDIHTEINRIRSANREATEQELRDLKVSIADYKRRAKELKDTNNPTKREMGGQKLNTAVAQELAFYDKLLDKAKQYGNAANDIVQSLLNQRAELYGTTDVETLYDSQDIRKVNDARLKSLEVAQKRAALEEKIRKNEKASDQKQLIELNNLTKTEKELQELGLESEETKSRINDLLDLLSEAKEPVDFKIYRQAVTLFNQDMEEAIKNAKELRKESKKEAKPIVDESILTAQKEIDNSYEKQIKNIHEIDRLRKQIATKQGSTKNVDQGEILRNQQRIDELLQNNNQLEEERKKRIAESNGQLVESIELQKKLSEAQEESTRKQGNYTDFGSERAQDRISAELKKYGKLDVNKYYGEAKTLLAEIQQEIMSINQKPLDMTDDSDVKRLDEIRNKLSEFEKLRNASEFMAANGTFLDKLELKISSFMEKNSAMGKEFQNQFEDLRIQIKPEMSKKEGDELFRQFVRLQDAVTKADKLGKSFFRTISERLRGLNAQLIAQYLSIQDMLRYARTVFETVRQLDTALVDLKKTTTMNNSDLEEFYQNSSNIARATGVTTQEIISQAAAWSRLGFSSKEAAETMAELSSQFAKISPGTSVEDATDYLVSTMKAFHIDFTDVESEIMDAINRIGNTMATSNSEVGEMLKRSSAAMAEANNTLAETIALESAAVQITRNAETTGTAFRTISMRIRGMDEETEEALENYEELKGKIADLTKTAKTPGGISLFTDETKTTYKSTYQLLKEIASIYHDLTDKQQAGLLEALAGKRGGQVLAGKRNCLNVQKCA